MSCGAHYAETCQVCPGVHGYHWCHGDCTWVERSSTCELTVALQSEAAAKRDWLWPALRTAASIYVPACLLLWVVMVVYASVYRSRVVSEYPQEIALQLNPGSGTDWKVTRDRSEGLFTVFREPHTLMWALCCPSVLAAKNYHVGNVLNFWPSCIILTVTLYTPLLPIGLLIRAVLSNRLMGNMRYNSDVCIAIVLGMFCLPCDIGRESLEVDDEEYMLVGCPFSAESTWQEPLKQRRLGEACVDRLDCLPSYAGKSRLWADQDTSWFGPPAQHSLDSRTLDIEAADLDAEGRRERDEGFC